MVYGVPPGSPTRESHVENGENGENGENEQRKKPSSPAPQDDTFADFWKNYPKRDGKKLSKRKAVAQWRKLSGPKRRDALSGVRHYRNACDSGVTKAKDAFRWLRDACWEDWQTPADLSANGARRPPQQPSPQYRDVDDLLAERERELAESRERKT